MLITRCARTSAHAHAARIYHSRAKCTCGMRGACGIGHEGTEQELGRHSYTYLLRTSRYFFDIYDNELAPARTTVATTPRSTTRTTTAVGIVCLPAPSIHARHGHVRTYTWAHTHNVCPAGARRKTCSPQIPSQLRSVTQKESPYGFTCLRSDHVARSLRWAVTTKGYNCCCCC